MTAALQLPPAAVRDQLAFLGYDDGDVIEFQALKVKGAYDAEYTQSAFVRADQVEKVASPNTVPGKAQGVYLVANGIRPEATLRRAHNGWTRLGREDATKDADIPCRRVLSVDCDPITPASGISATEAERACARALADAVRVYLVGRGVPEAAIGTVDSGNGYQVWVALDALPVSVETDALIRNALVAIAAAVRVDGAKIDTSIYDRKRLLPIAGTRKCKGVEDADRKHRQVTWDGPVLTHRLCLDELRALVPPAATPVEKPKPMEDGPDLARAKALDMHDTARRYGLHVDGDNVECPGCHRMNGSMARILPSTSHPGTSVIKCQTATCAPHKCGVYTTVDVAMVVRGISLDAAVKELLVTGTAATPTASEPTAADPFAGLSLLRPLSIVGKDRYLALAAEPVVYTWDGIAMQGITVGMTGAPGEGKTTLMFLIAVARGVTDGTVTRVLGLDVTPAPDGNWIVIVEAEHGESSAARKLVKSADVLGLDASCLDRVITVARKSVLLGSPEWTEIERMIAAGIVSDVFLDSIARVAPADANDEREQAAIFGRVGAAIESSKGTQPTFWIIMHSRKGLSTGNTEDISGSQQRGGQTDTTLRCTAVRDESLKVAHVDVTFPKLREEPDEHPGRRSFAIERVEERWIYRDVNSDEVNARANAPRAARAAAKQAVRAGTLEKEDAALGGILRATPGITGRALRVAMKAALGSCSSDRTDAAIARAKDRGAIRIAPGPHNSVSYHPALFS